MLSITPESDSESDSDSRSHSTGSGSGGGGRRNGAPPRAHSHAAMLAAVDAALRDYHARRPSGLGLSLVARGREGSKALVREGSRILRESRGSFSRQLGRVNSRVSLGGGRSSRSVLRQGSAD